MLFVKDDGGMFAGSEMAWDSYKSEKQAEEVSGMELYGGFTEVYFHSGIW